MHPNPILHWTDRDQLRGFVADVAFGALFAGTPDGPRVAHVPVVWLDDGTLGLHVSRGNGLARHLDGATALFVVQGPDGYVSPKWYGQGPEQVPTWNYAVVELEGLCRRMDRGALAAQVDQLVAEQEARTPAPHWTTDKMPRADHTRMLDMIVGFRLEIAGWRGTMKVGQNKPDAVRLAAADGVAASGRRGIAALMRAWG